jgi:hypothetical protein
MVDADLIEEIKCASVSNDGRHIAVKVKSASWQSHGNRPWTW